MEIYSSFAGKYYFQEENWKKVYVSVEIEFATSWQNAFPFVAWFARFKNAQAKAYKL